MITIKLLLDIKGLVSQSTTHLVLGLAIFHLGIFNEHCVFFINKELVVEGVTTISSAIILHMILMILNL
jgi:hypothetical protein